LKRDVSYVDLALVVVLRRVSPQVHLLISNQRLILTGGFKGLKHYQYLNDNDRSRREKLLAEQISTLCTPDDEKSLVNAILTALFPLFPKILGRAARASDPDELGNATRISSPWMFDAYFRYEIPKEVFGSSALEQFLELIESARGRKEVSDALAAILQSMEMGSERREDFMWKLSLSIRRLDRNIAKWLALSAMQYADQYVYDRDIRLWGESAYAFRIAREALEGMSDDERVDFLRDCIGEAGDVGCCHRLELGRRQAADLCRRQCSDLDCRDGSDLGRPTDRLHHVHRESHESLRGFDHESRQIDGILNRCRR